MKLMNLKLLLMALITIGSFTSCAKRADVENCESDNEVYVWPEGPKYYYAFDEKIFLDESPNKVVLRFEKGYLSEMQKNLQSDPQILHTEFQIGNDYCILTTIEDSNVRTLMTDLKKQAGVKSVNPIYYIHAQGIGEGIVNKI